MLDFIAIPMGHVLKFIYDMLAFKNYSIAIILLTVMVKTLLLPLYIKQYHSTSKLSEIQPQMLEIQKRYKNATYISVKYFMQQTPQTSDNQMQASMQKNMALISPVMTGFISFTVPAGLGLYWIIGNIYQIAQQMFMNRFVIKKKVKAEVNKEKERESSGGQPFRTHQRARRYQKIGQKAIEAIGGGSQEAPDSNGIKDGRPSGF